MNHQRKQIDFWRREALYGAGVPPYAQYIKYIGKPLYKLGRKLKISKVGALAVANIPGSTAHVSGLLYDKKWDTAALAFVISEVLCVGVMFGIHKLRENSRKKSSLTYSLDNLENEIR